uniref:Uncharacterized protein n=2 Tax=Avena sativa TaxID=4498 RepID=A0ACD5UX17_AVESA
MAFHASSRLLFLFLFAICCFLILSYHASAGAAAFSFDFDFSNRSTYYHVADLRFEADAAAPQAGLLDVNSSNQPSTQRRMSYKYPVPLYDTATGKVASFTTRFTFAIKGGGMAFFLSRLPPTSRSRGLHSGNTPGTNRSVAVQFSTCHNTLRPCHHIAIDIGTARNSTNATCLPSSILQGSITASIIFNSTTDMLLASLHLLDASCHVSMHLPAPVTSLLPPEVAVGFSAARRVSSFDHPQILSWSFNSTLATRTATRAPETQPKPAPLVTRKATKEPEARPEAAPAATIKAGAPGAQPKLAPLIIRKKTSAPAAQPNLAPMVARKVAPVTQRKLIVSEKDPFSTPEGGPYETDAPKPSPDQTGAPVPPRDQTGAPEPPPDQTSAPKAQSVKENKKLVIGGALASVAVLGSVVVWVIMSWYRWKRTRDSFVRGITGLKRFEHKILALATGRFSRDNKLGEGAFGAVYKGSYTDEKGRQEVAVKKIKQTTGRAGDFIAELKTISGTRHMNLVELKGWCCSRYMWDMTDFLCWYREQRVKLCLVYELVPNGTLHQHLHCRDRILPWEKRYQIIKGIGSALRYLHHECREPILHRDIKPSNILLDYDFNAKLADFGLSRTASQDNAMVLTRAIGTEGYMDPQCRKHGKVEFSRKSDVYSFGIVLLEIACTNKHREEVRELYRRDTAGPEMMMMAAADRSLGGVFDRTQMERVIVLGLRCSDPDGRMRPYMEDAMKFLEDGIELPAITEIEGQQGARFRGTISSDDHTVLTPGLPS